MRLLLDTHALVWALSASNRLSPTARSLIADPANQRVVSVASLYEIEYKRVRDESLRRLPIDLEQTRQTLVFDWLAIDEGHAAQAGRLPRFHGDPWDRIIVAQTLSEGLSLVSADPAMTAYGVEVIW